MAKVKLNLKDRSDENLSQLADQHIAAMTGNANFVTPNPLAPAFLTLATGFQDAVLAAEAARQSALQATSVRDTARIALEVGFNQRATYVESTSGFDETKILSSGLSTRDQAAPIGELPAPMDFLATMGDQEGEIDLTWSSVRGAKSYNVEKSPYATPRVWMAADTVVKSRMTVGGLTPGATYAFRVSAIGTAGRSPWSDDSVKMAP
jgi:hypothetical protein